MNSRRLTAVLFVLLAATLLPNVGFAFSTWDAGQEVEVDSNTFNQVLIYDFATGTSTVNSVTFGDSSATYLLREDAFIGGYLYDFSAQRFVNSFYATGDTL